MRATLRDGTRTNMRLKVCLIGAMSAFPAEGMQNVYRALREKLASSADVLALDGRNLARGQGWVKIIHFQPQIIHYLAGPSNVSFVMTAATRVATRNARTIMSSLHPVGVSSPVARLFAPDLMLVQASDSASFYRDLGIATEYLPNGVDKQRFSSVSQEERTRLRREYGLPGDRRIVLHVGHLKRGRNVTDLVALQAEDTQVLIVASPATRPEPGVREELERAGVLVWTHYLPGIEDVYRMADVYAFPVRDRTHCIEMPLSVMEAAAAGLPVVSTAFGALPRLYPQCESFRYYTHATELPQLVRALQAPAGELRQRTPDWNDVGQTLISMYERLFSCAARPGDVGSTL
jgi:glycosyltransferase involved in cell wall biosynthesis